MQPPRSRWMLACLAGALASLSSTSSCLDITPPGTAFASDPPGARVLIDGRDSGWVTPCMIALEDEEPTVVSFALVGYAPRDVTLLPDYRRGIVTWYEGVNGVRSNVRFPIFLPTADFIFPLREIETLAPGRVFVRLRPEDS